MSLNPRFLRSRSPSLQVMGRPELRLVPVLILMSTVTACAGVAGPAGVRSSTATRLNKATVTRLIYSSRDPSFASLACRLNTGLHPECCVLSCLMAYWFWSAQLGLDHGVRHLTKMRP